MKEHRHLTRDGVALQVLTAGRSEPTVVVLPGFGAGIDGYGPFLQSLARRHQVVGVSPRGFGSSGWSAPYAIADWIDDVVDVVTGETRGPVVVVGHSFGAWLGLAAAVRVGATVRAVVSLDQVLDLDAYLDIIESLLDHWQTLQRLVRDADGDSERLANALADAMGDGGRTAEVDALARRWSVQDPRVLASLTPQRFRAWMTDPAISDLPSRFDGLLLCVDGDVDAGSMVSAGAAARVLDLYPRSQQVRLDGLGHDLALHRDPDRVVEALRWFVDDQA